MAKPNVLLVITDDQPYYTTKFMESLQNLVADKGADFARAYCAVPLCDPARASVLLGKHLHNHMMPSNASPGGGARVFKDKGWEPQTYLAHMKDLGYITGYFGKWIHEEWGHKPVGVDVNRVFAGSPHEPQYFDIYSSTSDSVKRVNRYNADGTENYDDTDFMRDNAADFIEARRGSANPFICVFAPFAPHGPYGEDFIPKRVEDKYHNLTREPGPYDDKPEHYEPTVKGEDDAGNRKEYQDKRREIDVVDDAVRVLVNKLVDIGELENTIIVFLTDQPYMLGEHGLQAKGKFYDYSSQIPLIFKGPGIPEGVKPNRLASAVDIFPTLLEAAGADPALIEASDGESLWPIFRGEVFEREHIIVEHKAGQGFRMVHDGSYVYVAFDGGGRVAYDMVNDPQQRTNIIGSLSASERDRLEALLPAPF